MLHIGARSKPRWMGETSSWKQTRVTEGNPSELLQIPVQTNALDRERMIYRDHKSNVFDRNEAMRGWLGGENE